MDVGCELVISQAVIQKDLMQTANQFLYLTIVTTRQSSSHELQGSRSANHISAPRENEESNRLIKNAFGLSLLVIFIRICYIFTIYSIFWGRIFLSYLFDNTVGSSSLATLDRLA